MKEDIDFYQDSKWLNDNYDELKKEYAGRAIAIINQDIFHSDEDYIKLLDFLRENDIDPGEIFVEVFPEDDVAYIL